MGLGVLRFIVLALSLIGSGTQAIGADVHNRELCTQIEKFSRNISQGAARSVELSTELAKTGEPTLLCRPVPMEEPAISFCRFLSEHSSAEALAGNVMRISACVSGNTFPTAKNLSVDDLTGRFTASGIFSSDQDVDVELEYSYRRDRRAGDFVKITSKRRAAIDR